MNDLLQNPMFFYAVAFTVFIGLAYRYGKKPFLNWLDTEIRKISDELAEAQRLRTEAEATLQDYKNKQAEAADQAQTIIQEAHLEAERLKSQAADDLKATLTHQEKLALDRIHRAETEALAAVRHATIELAVSSAEKTFQTQINETIASRLIDQAIDEIPTTNPTQAKAA